MIMLAINFYISIIVLLKTRHFKNLIVNASRNAKYHRENPSQVQRQQSQNPQQQNKMGKDKR